MNKAVEIIKKGGLVVFPTETVYGLGANGLNDKAVKKIFQVKGRPQDNPLILHVSSIEQVERLVEEIPDNARKLMERFWPGPLTIVMKKSKIVPDSVTCGLDSVAIRMPKNKIALDLIKECNCPLAAPSANISGRPSPTSVEHVVEDLAGKVDMIIDGGRVKIGIESTVIDLTDKPRILRLGKITKKEIEKVIGKVDIGGKAGKPKSPGMKYKHYSPNARVIIASKEDIKKYSGKVKVLKYRNAKKMAKNLFKDFRDADKKGYEIILVVGIKAEGFGSAVMDRLRKAAN